MTQQSFLQANAANTHPTYAGSFRCIGPECEDTCCGVWDIPLDKRTYLKYQQFPAEALGAVVSHFVTACAGHPHDNLFAFIHRKPDGACPFFGEDRLCSIQTQHGPQMLSSTCSIYPRSLAMVGGVLEGSLSLSCPEAARMVLLEENSTKKTGELLSGKFRTDNVFHVQEYFGLDALLPEVRALIGDLICDRSRPLWQGLLMIAALVIGLDGVGDHDLTAAREIFAQFSRYIGTGSLLEFDRLAAGVPRRLELAVTLSGELCRDKNCSRRFQDLYFDFIQGIGSTGSPEFNASGLDEDVQRFQHASSTYLEPLLRDSPFLMENYLLNSMYQHLFPFGRAGSDRMLARSISEQAVLLLVQYSWMTTLLTGVAGRHGAEFCNDHIVAGVQSFTRAVEHTPHVLENALAFVRSRELDTISGLAMLLRT